MDVPSQIESLEQKALNLKNNVSLYQHFKDIFVYVTIVCLHYYEMVYNNRYFCLEKILRGLEKV